jgi:glycerate 2-kinase
MPDIRFLVIPDSFKHCMTAMEAGQCIKQGILQAMPEAQVTIMPVADGGEGFTKTLIEPLGGKTIPVKAHDALMRPIETRIGLLPDNTAIIEMAGASGIEWLASYELNPLKTSTFGTGELIMAALDAGCTRIIMGIGGSATNDGGVGMAMALGVKFFDNNGKLIPPGGQFVGSISMIDMSGIDSRLQHCTIEVACDVINPLTGPHGASVVYGPQKGASPHMVHQLDENLKYLACVIKTHLGLEVDAVQGSGAAGGLGAGLMAFTNARLIPGFRLVQSVLALNQKVEQCDVVVTAEGQFDAQSAMGKVPSAVLGLAQQYQKPLWIFTGANLQDNSESLLYNKAAVFSICQKPVTLSESMQHAKQWLTFTSFNAAKVFFGALR